MTDPIIRLNAALEGRYCIERELGEGGHEILPDTEHTRRVEANFQAGDVRKAK